MEDIIKIILEVVDKNLGTAMKKVDNMVEASGKNTQKFMQGTQAFLGGMQQMMMGIGLSMLFTGMAIKNFFQNMLTGLMTNFLEIEGQSSAVGNSINALKAHFISAFYDIIDAANEAGVLEKWITRLDELASWIEGHPDLFAFLVDAAVWAIILGAAMMVIGQITLGLLAPLAIVMFIVQNWGTAMVVLNKAIAIFTGGTLLGILLQIGAATIVVLGAVWAWGKVMNSKMPIISKLLLGVGILMAGIIVAALILGFTITLPFILAVAAIAVVITAFELMRQELGSVGNAFKAFGIFLLAIFAFVGDALIEVILSPLRLIILAIQTMIDGYNKLAAAKGWKTLGVDLSGVLPDVGSLSKKVWEMRNNLLEAAELEKKANAEQEAKDKAAKEAKEAEVATGAQGLGYENPFGNGFNLNIEQMNVMGDEQAGQSMLDKVQEAIGFSEGSTNNNTGA